MSDDDFKDRAFFGFLLAVNVPGIVFCLIFVFVMIWDVWSWDEVSAFQGFERTALGIFLVLPAACLISLAPGFFLGIPLIVGLRRRRWERWWHYALGGACVGPVFVVITASIIKFGISRPSQENSTDHYALLVVCILGAVMGALSALAFWYMVYRRQPAIRSEILPRQTQG